MTSATALHLPAAFARVDRDDGFVAVRRGWEEAFGRMDDEYPDRYVEQAVRTAGATPRRGVGLRIPLKGRRDDRGVVRFFRRGGWVRWLGPYYFHATERFLEELQIAEDLVERGIPTAEILLLRVRRHRMAWTSAYLVTREITGTRDLWGAWSEAGEGFGARLNRLQEGILDEAARFVATLHDAGLEHPDLNLRNILVRGRPGKREYFVLDLDRARVGESLGGAERWKQLRRLYRSFEKLRAGHGVSLGPEARARFLRAYLSGRAPSPAWDQAARRCRA